MSLNLAINQHISCDKIVSIAEKAAEAILAVYNSKVGCDPDRETNPYSLIAVVVSKKHS